MLTITPVVIFTTAYDEYALRAFEVNALDYLMKPIEPARLAAALARAAEPALPEPEAPVERLTASDQVFVKDGDRYWFVQLDEVRLFESEGNYTRLFFGHERPLVYRSLSYLEERLDPKMFFRASRKHIINLRWVRKLDAWFNGGLIVELEGGLQAEMSRRQAQRFREMRSF